MEALLNPIEDKKINSFNILVEMQLMEYYNLVKDVMKKNDFQRNKLRASKTVYSLLKQDLIDGCIIPPIVLAVNTENVLNHAPTKEDALELIELHKDRIFILDGLQRTYTIQDIVSDVENGKVNNNALCNKIRVEIYLNLNREGVLYRMLTLNTGQTPMSLRHQIEIIYSTLDSDENNRCFRLIHETDEIKDDDKVIGTYKFVDAIDAFTSFLQQDYVPLKREDLLGSIKTFSGITTLADKTDVFSCLLTTYTAFQKKAEEAMKNLDIIESIDFDNPFGKNTYGIFSKSQAMTGFGAAVARLIEVQAINEVSDINAFIDQIDVNDFGSGIINMLTVLNDFRIKSKKIGNSQRCFFYYFFKSYFDKEITFLKMNESIEKAVQLYNRES